MPALTLLLLGVALGALFAWSAAEELQHRQSLSESNATAIVFAFSLLAYAPSTSYLLSYNTDWSVGYWFDTIHLPNVTFALVALALASAPVLGYWLAAPASSDRAAGQALALGGASVLLVLLNTLIGLRRLMLTGSFRQFQDDYGLQSLAGSSLGYTLLWTMLVLAVLAFWTHTALRRLGSPTNFPHAGDR